MNDEELKKTLNQNKEVLNQLDARLHRIEKRLAWNTVFGFLRMIVIWGPIIAGVIYFTPILRDYIKIFEPVFTAIKSGTIDKFNAGNSNDFAVETICDPQARQALVNQLCEQ